MDSWIDVYDFIAGKLREMESTANYYRDMADRLRTENDDLKKQLRMEEAKYAENALETAR